MNHGFIKRLIAFAALLAVLAACGGGGGSPIRDNHGDTVYTQVNMWVENDQHLTTNYRAGYLVPINTQVEIVNSNRRDIIIRIPDLDREARIVNQANHSLKDVEGIYNRYFASTPADLSGFDRETRELIKAGEVREGMSRDAVLLARGYPPAHHTPTLDQNTWTYWRNRFARQIVTFTGDTVADLEGF